MKVGLKAWVARGHCCPSLAQLEAGFRDANVLRKQCEGVVVIIESTGVWSQLLPSYAGATWNLHALLIRACWILIGWLPQADNPRPFWPSNCLLAVQYNHQLASTNKTHWTQGTFPNVRSGGGCWQCSCVPCVSLGVCPYDSKRQFVLL